jgi:hypothetical protein
MPRTPMIVASKFRGANKAQYVAAATHIKCTASASIASNGKLHHGSLYKYIKVKSMIASYTESIVKRL